MQEQNKSKVTYWLNGEQVSKEEFGSLVGEYFKWFDGNDVKAVDYSFIESLFNGEHKSQRQINDHLKSVLGGYKKPNVKINSTRHKAREEGKFHKYPLTPEESFVKDDVITSSNRGEKEMMERFKEITIPFNNGSEQVKVRVCSPECFCDGSCKEEIKEPFNIQVPKPNPFNQSNFFDKIEQERQLRESFERRVKELDKKEGVKETEGKLNYELDWQFIQQLAERMSQNKGKYEPYNWTKPMDVEKLKQSLFRHVIEVMKGNYLDDGREFGHWESIALNVMMINYQLRNNR